MQTYVGGSCRCVYTRLQSHRRDADFDQAKFMGGGGVMCGGWLAWEQLINNLVIMRLCLPQSVGTKEAMWANGRKTDQQPKPEQDYGSLFGIS